MGGPAEDQFIDRQSFVRNTSGSAEKWNLLTHDGLQ